MSTLAHAGNRNFSQIVDDEPCAVAPLGPMMDLDAIAKAWARAILDNSVGLTQKQRERLRDIARPDRLYFSRSALNVLMDLAAFASPGAAVWGAEAIRGTIIGRLETPTPTWSEAFLDEERANHVANVEQIRWIEGRTRAHADAVCFALTSQERVSRIAADAVWRSVAATRTITYASR